MDVEEAPIRGWIVEQPGEGIEPSIAQQFGEAIDRKSTRLNSSH